MNLNCLYIFLGILIGCIFSKGDSYPGCYENEQESAKILDAIGSLPAEAWDVVGYKQQWLDLQNRHSHFNEQRSELGCLACVALVDLLQDWMIDGESWEECRAMAVDLCMLGLPLLGYREDILCEKSIDIFLPHALHIANMTKTSMDGEELCLKLQSCSPILQITILENSDKKGNVKLSEESRKTLPTPPVQAFRKGLQDTLRIVHISDIHVDEKYVVGSKSGNCGLFTCCRPEIAEEGDSGYWGHFECNNPPRTSLAFLEYIHDLDPDFIIYTGDNNPHAVWDQTLWSQINTSRWVTDSIRDAMPFVDAYPAIGNHETFPTSLYYVTNEDTKVFNHEYGEMWHHLAGFKKEQLDTIEYNGCYTLLVRPGLRLLSFNSHYGYPRNWYNVLNDVGDDFQWMVDWMNRTLSAARDNGEKVLLISHSPTGTSGTLSYYSQFVTDISLRFSDVIIAHLLGHTHKDEFILVVDPEDGMAKGTQLVAPSLNTKTNVNPAAKLYYMDKITFELLDYEVHFFNMSANKDNQEKPEINKIYTARGDYGIPDLTPASWQSLVHRFHDDNDLFLRYRWNRQSRSDMEGECDDECKWHELCHIQSSTYHMYQQCMNSKPK